MKHTNWAPNGVVDDREWLLGRLVRSALPSSIPKGRGLQAQHLLLPLVANGKQVFFMMRMHWRIREMREWENRESAELEFSGRADHSGGTVEFFGEAILDLATGAYFEFHLSHVD